MSTAIEWADATWNPITGCTKVSLGCANCYAMAMAKRLKAMGNPRYQKDGGAGSGPGFGVSLHPDVLAEPLHWRKPRRVFVVSMGDLFHEDVPDEFIDRVFHVMAQAKHHTFQVLTKRPDRMRRHFAARCGQLEVLAAMGGRKGTASVMPHIQLGVSVENQRMADERVPLLLETPAAVRFLSCEPLLGPLDLRAWMSPWRCEPPGGKWREGPWDTLDWVIVGGESGPGRAERKLVERCECENLLLKAIKAPDGVAVRCSYCDGTFWRPKPHALEWARSLRDQCQAADVPFFFKQWGGPRPTSGGRLLDDREHNEMPS